MVISGRFFLLKLCYSSVLKCFEPFLSSFGTASSPTCTYNFNILLYCSLIFQITDLNLIAGWYKHIRELLCIILWKIQDMCSTSKGTLNMNKLSYIKFFGLICICLNFIYHCNDHNFYSFQLVFLQFTSSSFHIKMYFVKIS